MNLGPENLTTAEFIYTSKSELVDHCISVANEPYYRINETWAMNIIDTISATGYTLKLPILFGWFKFEGSEEKVLLPYIITAFLMYFLAFGYIMAQLGRVTVKPQDFEAKDGKNGKNDKTGVNENTSKITFSNPISEYTFTCYDFSLAEPSAIILKKQQIKNVLAGLESEKDIQELKQKLRTQFYQWTWANLLNFRRILGNLLSLILLVILILLVTFSIYFQANYDDFFSVQSVQKIKSSFVLELIIQFLPQIVMGVCSVLGKILLRLIARIEVRRGGSELRISLLRVMILQYFLFSVFIGTNLLLATCYSRNSFLGFADVQWVQKCWSGSEICSFLRFLD